MYFNLKTLEFQNEIPNLNVTDYLKVVSCEHKDNNEIIALFYFAQDVDEPLHLHNDEFCSVEDESIAVEKFKKQDKTFVEHLDFFTSKNPRIQNPLINDFK